MAIALVGLEDQELIKRLRNLFEIHVFTLMPQHGTEFELVLVFKDDRYRIRNNKGKDVAVSADDFSTLVRAIRELSQGGDELNNN